MDHTIVHFEIPANDVAKLTKFYGELFGWKIEKTEGEGMDDLEYNMVTTVPTDERGRPTRAGVNGGIYKRQDPNTPFTYYVEVESIDDYMQKVEALGGRILGEKMEVPSMGWTAFGADPEGNNFALFQPARPE